MALTPVNISSYEAFKNEVLGNGYDVDGVYGYQCVDMPKLLAGNAGRPSPYWKSDPDGYAYEGWTNLTNRQYNAGDLFTLVYNRADVKKGDLVVLDGTSAFPSGHIAFANTDWNANTYSAVLLGQNQVDPNYTVGHVNTLTQMNVTNFLGAFRFNAWATPTPPPLIPARMRKKRGFNWAVFLRKIRQKYL